MKVRRKILILTACIGLGIAIVSQPLTFKEVKAYSKAYNNALTKLADTDCNGEISAQETKTFDSFFLDKYELELKNGRVINRATGKFVKTKKVISYLEEFARENPPARYHPVVPRDFYE